MEPWRAFTLGMMAAGLCFILVMGGLMAMRDDAWQKQIVGKGYAHYDTQAIWHWNNEK